MPLSKTSTALIILLILVSVLATEAFILNKRLSVAEKASLEEARFYADDLMYIDDKLLSLRSALEDYSCNATLYAHENPTYMSYFIYGLAHDSEKVDALLSYLSIAYEARGESMPYQLSHALKGISKYLGKLQMALASDKFDCSLLPDNSTLRSLDRAFQQLALINSTSQITPEHISTLEEAANNLTGLWEAWLEASNQR